MISFFQHHFCEMGIIVRRTQRDIIMNVHTGLHAKYTSFLPNFKGTYIFSKEFQNVLKYTLLKSFHWKPGCFCGQTDRQMVRERERDMTKLRVVFRLSKDAPEFDK
jgi:hypothetical protein